MAEHVTIANADAHEPKHITISVTGDNGKIITPSSSVSGTSTLEVIKESFITEGTDLYTVQIDDISTAQSAWVVVNSSGTVQKIYSVIDGVIITTDAGITPKIGGVSITNGGIVIANAGSAAGDVDSSTPTAANTVATGGAIEIATDGLSVNTVKAVFTIHVQRT